MELNDAEGSLEREKLRVQSYIFEQRRLGKLKPAQILNATYDFNYVIFKNGRHSYFIPNNRWM